MQSTYMYKIVIQCHLMEKCMFKLPVGMVCAIVVVVAHLFVKIYFIGNHLIASLLQATCIYIYILPLSYLLSALLQIPTLNLVSQRCVVNNFLEEVLFTSMASAICKHLDANQLKIREIRHAASAFSQILGRMAEWKGIWELVWIGI